MQNKKACLLPVSASCLATAVVFSEHAGNDHASRPSFADTMRPRHGTKLERIVGTTFVSGETFETFLLHCDEYLVPATQRCFRLREIRRCVMIGDHFQDVKRECSCSAASKADVVFLHRGVPLASNQNTPRLGCREKYSTQNGALHLPTRLISICFQTSADIVCMGRTAWTRIDMPRRVFSRVRLQDGVPSKRNDSLLDVSFSARDVELPNWFVPDFGAIRKCTCRLYSEIKGKPCFPLYRCGAGWLQKTETTYADSTHSKTGVLEGISVCINSVRPFDMLQSRELHRECLLILQRQGAVSLKCDDAWNDATKCSTLLDLRTLHHRATKLSSVQGNYSLLQQTTPRGVLPIYDMTDDNRKGGKLCFEEFLTEVGTTFKSLCSPYRSLGPKDREALFLQIFRSRSRVRLPYLTSLALDCLNLVHLSSSFNAIQQSTVHFWSPQSIAIGSGSILRLMLDTCEQRCSPREKANTVAHANDVQPEDHARKRHLNITDASEHENLILIEAAKRIEQNLKFVDVDGQDSLKGHVVLENKNGHNLWGAGIISPWMYYMSMGSVFCCHIEDYAFGSANAIIAPPDSHTWVVWYSVSRKDLGNLHLYLQDLMGVNYTLDCLEKRKVWLDPVAMKAWRGAEGEQINVFHHLQGPSEYVITDYGSVHWGVNLGVGWKAAVNFAFSDWRAAAELVHLVYKDREIATGQQRNYRCVPDFCSGCWG